MPKRKPTRPGDRGLTSLPGEGRVSKASARIAAVGDVDEASAALGAAASISPPDLKTMAERIQMHLFEVGADLSGAKGSPMTTMRRVRWLERSMERLDAGLPKLGRFVAPGGSPPAAALHVARAVCRRAERSAAGLDETAPVNPAALAYLNRLSSLLFTMARTANARAGVGEKQWPSRAK